MLDGADNSRGESTEETGTLATIGGRRCPSADHWRKIMKKLISEGGNRNVGRAGSDLKLP